MLIYIVELCVIVVLGLLLYSRQISKKTFIILAFAVLFLVLGLRGRSVGEDTSHFLDIFNYVQQISWKTAVTSGTDVIYAKIYSVDLSIEVGYLLLNKIIGIFTFDGQWLLSFCAFATCGLIGKFIYDNSENPFMATYIFMCEALYMQSFNLMRQMLALAIGIQVYTELKNNKNKKAIVWILSAFLIHKSSIVLLVLIPLFRIKNNQKAVKYVAIGGIAINLLIPFFSRIVSVLIPRYATYFRINYWGVSLNGTLLMWLIEIIICVVIYWRGIKEKETFIAVSCTILFLALGVLGINISMFQRIAMFFEIFLIFLIPKMTDYLSRNSKIFYRWAIIAILTMNFLSYAGSSTRVYSFFWQ